MGFVIFVGCFLIGITALGMAAIQFSENRANLTRFAAVVLTALLGMFISFMFRPSVPFVGQLPFFTVMTRGVDLVGVDALLKNAAEESFNYVLIGAILGAVVGAAWNTLKAKLQPSRDSSQPEIAPSVSADSRTDAYCTKCGKQFTPDIMFCGACGTRRA